MAGGHRQRRRLWQRCRRIAEELRPPGPFDVHVLIAQVGARLDRPIELLPLVSRSCGPCGVLVSTARAEYIGYPVDTTALHQQHIVLHELAHLLCGHGASGGTAAIPRVLLPHLSDELVRSVLGRQGYTEVEEQEAELIATLARQPSAGLPVRDGGRAGLDVVLGLAPAAPADPTDPDRTAP